MNSFSDFTHPDYQIQQELGHNRAGGRVTYLALHRPTQQQVVIKQFQFARVGTSWSEYDAYDREIQLLKQLNHPGIPQYLDSFQTPDGFCMVQEYKPAVSLATKHSFNPEEIRQIAIATLEILVYLQNRIPAIIHRDIKPENILLDEQGKVYLVDFGFARVGGEDVGVSSVVKGTLGFMPPEQLFNRQLTEASDLYGLGMTLICLLTGTKSDRIGDLVDISYRVSFKHLVSKLNLQWVNWLEKMVEPRLKDRFPNAVTALSALPMLPLRPPEAQFSRSHLGFQATRPGAQLVQSVVITNPIPDTLLEGEWEIAFHPHDPTADTYRWITVEPTRFVNNQVECQVAVDTRYLMAGKTYQRRLLLHCNTLAKTYSLNLQIQTAPVPMQASLLPQSLLLLGVFSLGISWVSAWLILVVGTLAKSSELTGFGAMVGAGIGLEFAAWLLRSAGLRAGATASTLTAIAVGITAFVDVLMDGGTTADSVVVLAAGVGGIGGTINGIVLGTVVEKLLVKSPRSGSATILAILTTLLGSSLGLELTLGFENPAVLTLSILSGIVLLILLLRFYLQQVNSRFSHRKSERYLIKP